MASMLQRIAAAAACALLLVGPASAQLVGSGHVMGNGTGASAAPTDTPLSSVLDQAGSGITRAGNTNKLATVSGTIANGHCRSTDANGNDIDAGGSCTTGGGGGTVNSGTTPQFSYYATSGPAVSGMSLSNSLLGPNVNNVVSYGADATGVTDSSAAFNSAVSAALAGTVGGSVYVPCGRYKLDSAVVTIAIPLHKGFSMFGGGSDCTIMYTTAGSPFVITLADPESSTFHLRDFSVTTKAVNTGTAIAISTSVSALSSQQNNAGNDISGVTIRGDDAISGGSPFRVDGFSTDVVFGGGVSNVDINNFSDPGTGAITGTAFEIFGDATDSTYALNFNFVNPIVYFKNIFIGTGSWVQGYQLSNPIIVGVNFGFAVNGTAGEFFGIEIAGGQFACFHYCITGSQIIADVAIVGTSFVQNAQSATGANTLNAILQGLTISGSFFYDVGGTPSDAIVTQNGSKDIVISGNSFFGWNTAVVFQATTTNANLQSNIYDGVGTISSPASTTGSIRIGGGSP